MGVHYVTLIPGDGIGPEVTAAARTVLDASGVEIAWDVQLAGAAAERAHRVSLPAATLSSVRERGAALKGPTATVPGCSHSANRVLRAELGLHTGVRPCRSFPKLPIPFPDVDLVIIRMNGEDLYSGIEFASHGRESAQLRTLIEETHRRTLPADVGFSIKPLSGSAARTTLSTAYQWAREHRRSRVTIVHKATVMPQTDGVFLKVGRQLARSEGDGLMVDDGLVDTVCGELARRPERYDVLVMPVLYGDLVSDLAAGLVGGPGLAPGANIGASCAVFEAVHGSAPEHAGTGRANPLALVLSGAMLLRHLGEASAAWALEQAVAELIRDGQTLTYDLRFPGDDRPPASTAQVAEALAGMLRS